ncbi:glycoside hydrolase family 88 protein [Bacteroides sp.]|uniref:glycoside hydrolase family 88/105 protein n=1 Tax=Bacteroides sp. TaxID=29523 RepID=UPI002612DF87|nr:glycoside hydrolase family 88 protein [Bacteroides sp.]MDD3036266.1 glycoside hydrolase family 88 protein [Bacteroides sp.]
MFKKIVFVLLLAFSFQLLPAQTSQLKNFPEGYTPEEIGTQLAYRFIDTYKIQDRKWIGYADTFSWNGSVKFAAIAKDKELLKLLQQNFEPLFSTQKKLLPVMKHVDWNMFGSLPLEFYQITKDKRYLELGLPFADTQWEAPENAKPKEKEWDDKGYSWQTRLWIDDMYMITIIQTQAYKVTKDKKYIDRAAKEMVLYLDELQRPNGLFYHAPDVPFYWGRGNGWMAAGMTELLRCLPKKHKDRPRILKGYQTMMKSLLCYQTPNGMWNQLIDQSDCWAETSGSAMFAYAFINGVKHGWLDAKEYAPAARKAWIALVSYIDEKGDVKEVCVGTNKKNDKQYYYDRPRHTGDYHGQAPYLWCAVALLEK